MLFILVTNFFGMCIIIQIILTLTQTNTALIGLYKIFFAAHLVSINTNSKISINTR